MQEEFLLLLLRRRCGQNRLPHQIIHHRIRRVRSTEFHCFWLHMLAGEAATLLSHGKDSVKVVSTLVIVVGGERRLIFGPLR